MCSSTDTGDNQDSNTSEQQRNLENWLPITASRKAKWWYSAFHNITAVVGAGVLGLPYAMTQLGWIPGIAILVVSWLVTLYSLWQLVEMHECVPGVRFDRYPELGEYVFGKKRGYWIVMPQQLVVQVATNIVYMVTGGNSIKKFFELLVPTVGSIRKTYFIIIFGGVEVLLAQTPNFNSLRGISLLAAVMSVCYSAIAFIASTIRGSEHHREARYGLRATTTAGTIFGVFNGMGTMAFAFAGHSVALEIQATIPSTPEKPSSKPMWKGVIVAYVVLAFCYFSVSISGYWAFGVHVDDDVLVTLSRPKWLIAIANLMVFLHVVGSYQVFAMPVFDQIETYLVKDLKCKPGYTLRLFGRSIYVILTALVAVCIPFFGGLLGFFGGLVFASTSFFLPCIMWLILKKPKRWSFHWTASWFAIIFGSLIMVLAPIGGARTIIISAKDYTFFS
ncbi:lysine histidine transporter-like 5 [Telopea speciosissima]|uniref:lysine histidine transporter-like 5 n=1 Tax=Telopea speciosissima TaxID=54955 RepID=UPI001CC71DA6|nr:lysine histidine transporter-like 5 [Telopea speciosissima]